MKIESINIEGIGGLEQLNITFNPYMNIICGPNGIGKTTILECIAQSFTLSTIEYLRKKADYETGKWELKTKEGQHYHVQRINFHPNDDKSNKRYSIGYEDAKHIIYIKTNRAFEYIPLNSISNDVRQSDDARMLINGLSITDAKNWFVNRHLWSAHLDSLTEAQHHNLSVAKTIFNKTDPGVSFSRVNGGGNDILLKQHDGTEIYFEYLSSGYKAVIFILLGLIKEIEHRFSHENMKVEDFNGVVLIDEIDLHLHPQWQTNILAVLTGIFPNAQFITSTHSAHVIQEANPEEVVSLGRDSKGKVYKRELKSTVYGYKGWTVEEILTDVMGLNETRSTLFVQKLDEFEEAIEAENPVAAAEIFSIISEMLHPNNNFRKLLKIQLASLGSVLND